MQTREVGDQPLAGLSAPAVLLHSPLLLALSTPLLPPLLPPPLLPLPLPVLHVLLQPRWPACHGRQSLGPSSTRRRSLLHSLRLHH